MKRVFAIKVLFACLVLGGAILGPGCSKKSGCPAEDVHMEMDKDGAPKVGKTESGLLPPKGSKKYKYTKYKKRKRKH